MELVRQMTDLPRLATIDALAQAVDLKGKRVIDVGAGDGNMARAMAGHGAHVLGVECAPQQLARAHAAAKVADERYVEGVGQALPAPDASADLVVFINSLHHVPVDGQAQALAEAARVLVPGGLLYIAEPLAEGAMFHLMQPVNDETEVRAAAYARVGEAPALGFEPVWEKVHLMVRRLSDLETLRDQMLAIDPGRAPLFEQHDAELRRRFEAIPLGPFNMRQVDQPIRVNLLRKAS